MFLKLLDKIANKLGYAHNEDYVDVCKRCDEQQMEIGALLNSLGYLQRENHEQNLLLTCVISAHGNEEETLTKAFLSDILSKGLETVFGQDDNGDVKLHVQLKPQICEDCGGVCGECDDDENFEE